VIVAAAVNATGVAKRGSKATNIRAVPNKINSTGIMRCAIPFPSNSTNADGEICAREIATSSPPFKE
jgi:hypothetical protein